MGGGGGGGGVFMIQGWLSGDGMNSFQNASHFGMIGIAPFLLFLRMLMIFCFFVLPTKPMSEGIWNVIIEVSRDLMSPEPDIVYLNGVFGAKYGGTYRAPVGFA